MPFCDTCFGRSLQNMKNQDNILLLTRSLKYYKICIAIKLQFLIVAMSQLCNHYGVFLRFIRMLVTKIAVKH
jgi:hypothetical protein